MNTNVSDMPLEIFGDYVSDTLDIEFPWEYLVFACNGKTTPKDLGMGCYRMNCGVGVLFPYGYIGSNRLNVAAGNGFGKGNGFGYDGVDY